MNETINLIGSVGFPIVACVYMARYHTQCMEKVRQSLESNTLAITELATLIKVTKQEDNDAVTSLGKYGEER